MQVSVRSHNVELTDFVRAIAQRKVDGLQRLLQDAWRVELDFADQRNPRVAEHTRCSARLHLRRGRLTAHAAGRSPEAALDLCIAKLRHQAERLKGQRVTARVRRSL